MLVFFTNLSFYLGQIFGFISSFLSNKEVCLVLDEKSSQEYPGNARVFQGSIRGLTVPTLH